MLLYILRKMNRRVSLEKVIDYHMKHNITITGGTGEDNVLNTLMTVNPMIALEGALKLSPTVLCKFVRTIIRCRSTANKISISYMKNISVTNNRDVDGNYIVEVALFGEIMCVFSEDVVGFTKHPAFLDTSLALENILDLTDLRQLYHVDYSRYIDFIDGVVSWEKV